jgi:hypothetical protein
VTAARRVEVAPGVVFREVGGEAVLLDLASERYFTLDATGTRMWALLAEHGETSEVVHLLLAEYEIDEAVLERDLDELIERLLSEGLVVVRDPA